MMKNGVLRSPFYFYYGKLVIVKILQETNIEVLPEESYY